MLKNKSLFDALLSSGKGEGMTRSGLAIQGEAGTFIAMLTMAAKWDDPGEEAAADPRLR